MRALSLASGSSANGILIQAGASALLIDAGVSARSVLAGLASLGLRESALAAILLTHEHSDHTRGLESLGGRFTVPVVGSRGTLRGAGLSDGRSSILAPGDCTDIAGVCVRSFPLSHDAGEPTGYLLECGGASIGLATDTGVVLPEIRERLRGADLAIVESNHDVERLRRGPYPEFLKQRILSDHGHLSNEVAAGLIADLLTHRAGTHVWLAHLSATNNTPRLAHEATLRGLAAAGLTDARVQVLPRRSPGPIWEAGPKAVQLTLF